MFWLWAGFLVLIVVLLALDLGVLHRGKADVTLRDAAIFTIVWVSIGLGFTAVVYLVFENHLFGATLRDRDPYGLGDGAQAALLYVTGYLVEQSLSVDNIFVMALVFDRFQVAGKHRHRVLYWGILGALVFRAVVIFSGVWLIHRFSWLFYVFGAYLAFTGAKLLKGGEDDVDPESMYFVRIVRRILPVAKGDYGDRFVTRENGKLLFTQLFLVLLVIEGTDVIFALDSIPAILAITTEPFVVFTSNIFAILGLRSLYFVLRGMLERFKHLKVALSFILIFIGVKMLLHHVYIIPNLVSLGVIAGALAVGMISSVMFGKADAAPTDHGGSPAGE